MTVLMDYADNVFCGKVVMATEECDEQDTSISIGHQPSGSGWFIMAFSLGIIFAVMF